MFPGGWSDTPPITYEHGGAVVNMAVLVDGDRPMGAQARRIPEPVLRLHSKSGPLRAEIQTDLNCRSLSDLQDYCQPQAPGDTKSRISYMCCKFSINVFDVMSPPAQGHY